jgi:hypothetical protein
MGIILVDPLNLSQLSEVERQGVAKRLEDRIAFSISEDLYGAVESFEAEAIELGTPIEVEYKPLETTNRIASIFKDVWGRPVSLTGSMTSSDIGDLIAVTTRCATWRLDGFLDTPVGYTMEGEYYEDLSWRTILESTSFERTFQESIAELNGLYSELATQNFTQSLRNLHEIHRIAG